MAEAVGALRVDVAANVAQITGDMRAVRSAISTNIAGIQSSLGKFNAASMASAASVGALRTGMMALGAFVAGTLTRQMVASTAAIGDIAARLGLTTDALQVWRYAAATVGVSAEDMQKAFEKLNQKLGETSESVTPTQLALSKLHLTIAQLKGLGPDEQMKLIADRIGQIRDPAQRSTVAIELFSEKGAELLGVFSKGSKGINAIATEMRNFGLVLSGETIKKAQEANREFVVIETLVGNAGKAMSAEMLPALRAFRELITDPAFQTVLKGFGTAIGGIMQAVAFGFNTIQAAANMPTILAAAGRVGDLTHELIAAKENLDKLFAEGEPTDIAARKYQEAADKLAAAKAKLAEVSKGSGPLEQPNAPAMTTFGGFDAAKAAAVAETAKKLAFEFQKLQGDFKGLAEGFPDLAFGLGIFNEQTRRAFVNSGELSGSLKMLSTAQLAVNAAKLNQDMATPLQKYNLEVAKLNQLMGTGVLTQEAYNLKLRELKEGYAQANVAGIELQSPLQKYNEQLTKINELLRNGVINQKLYNEEVVKAQDAYATASKAAISYKEVGEAVGTATGNALTQMVFEGKSWAEAMQGFIAEVIKELFRLIVVKTVAGVVSGGVTSGLGAAFGFANGAAFGGGKVIPFANGGIVSGPTSFPMKGGMGLMGEAGPEAVMPLERGPDGSLGISARGGGGSSISIDARGSDAGVVDRIMSAMAMLEKGRPNPISQQQSYRKRFPTR